jgi:hypothetical protein
MQIEQPFDIATLLRYRGIDPFINKFGDSCEGLIPAKPPKDRRTNVQRIAWPSPRQLA